MQTSHCPRCNSDKIARGVRFMDYKDVNSAGDAMLEIRENPGALLFYNSMRFEMVADVCGECGNVELRVKNPRELWESYGRQQENLKSS